MRICESEIRRCRFSSVKLMGNFPAVFIDSNGYCKEVADGIVILNSDVVKNNPSALPPEISSTNCRESRITTRDCPRRLEVGEALVPA